MTCKPIKRTTAVRIECEPRHLLRYSPHQWGSEEYWRWAEQQAQEWCREFHDFMRDHRSQDAVSMNVVRDTEEVCSECGSKWDPTTLEGDTHISCAYCGVEAAPAAKESQ